MNEFEINQGFAELLEQLLCKRQQLIDAGVVASNLSEQEFDQLSVTIDTPELSPELELYIVNRYIESINRLLEFEDIVNEHI
jgi:hypothetical protein